VRPPMSTSSGVRPPMTPLRVNLSPRSIARSSSSVRPASTATQSSRSPDSGSSVSSLIRRFDALGHPAGYAPVRHPPRAARDLSNYRR
jgi:hypothetical protein